MIINKISKDFQTRSDLPDTNWMDDEWVVVPDESDLAEKVLKYFPRFDMVFDEDGEVVDIIEIPKTEEEKNAERVEEIKKELEELDKTINRATEDLYELTEATPYQSTQKVINRKIELRNELKKII